MQANEFIPLFNASISFITPDWKRLYGDLLVDEHWNIIGANIYSFVFHGEIHHHPLPRFDEEIIVDYREHYHYFEPLRSLVGKPEHEQVQFIADLIQEAPIESILIILGQRKTSATISDSGGIPPTKEALFERSFEPYNDQVCKAARAREKHVSRNKHGNFWGKIKGTPAEKEQAAKAIVQKVIEEKTWWNVFTHYKHDVVYEVRVASGEGIRWRKKDLELIGFLEPFLND